MDDDRKKTKDISELTNIEIIHRLMEFDTATICNVVATYPDSEICLKLYDAWHGEYYTDQSLHCMYPSLGPICGYAATAWYSQLSADYTNIDEWVLFDHLDETQKPIVLVAKQTYPSEIANLSGLFGGNMTAQFKALGVVGVVTDGSMRDYEEIKEMKVQYLATGFTSGHGPLMLRGADIPVKVAGMSISPGDIVHMDVCGATKFPEKYLLKVLEYATELKERETKFQSVFREPNFTYKKWKENEKKNSRNL